MSRYNPWKIHKIIHKMLMFEIFRCFYRSSAIRRGGAVNRVYDEE